MDINPIFLFNLQLSPLNDILTHIHVYIITTGFFRDKLKLMLELEMFL